MLKENDQTSKVAIYHKILDMKTGIIHAGSWKFRMTDKIENPSKL